MPGEEWDNGQRKSFLKALTAWKSRHLLGSPSIEGANKESAILTAHWGPIFGCEADIREDAWSHFEGQVPLLPWPKVRCDVPEIATLLARLLHTAAGPDGITNAMLASTPIAQGGLTPSSWHDAQVVLLPKDEANTLLASKFRHWRLQILLARYSRDTCCSSCKVSSRPSMQPAQRGFMPKQSIALAISRLEWHAHVAASMSFFASLLLCDLKCLILSGVPDVILAFLRDLLKPSTLFFVWKQQGESVLRMVGGTPQGGPCCVP
eukprot:1414300-Amphidinium_carterae.3